MPVKEISSIRDIEILFDRLFPIPRSISGKGFLDSLRIISEYIPLDINSVESGEKIYDWTVPEEWIIDDAYLIDPNGNKLLDFKYNNLCIVSYSEAVDMYIELPELKKYIYTIPEHPSWTPYVTSYYKKSWGLCMPHSMFSELIDGTYRVVIKSKFINGHINYGTYFLPATVGDKDSRKTILISSYLCHPSMANNELSGPIILSALFQKIASWEIRRFNYLFLINPETIGSICFLHNQSMQNLQSIEGGLVLNCLGGGSNHLNYKKSRRGNSSLDDLMLELNESSPSSYKIRNFDPSEGSDERQFCGGTLNLPIGQISKTTYGTYPEYHTSADDRDFVQLQHFPKTIAKLEHIFQLNEYLIPLNRFEPYCELQLGKRGLYPNINKPTSLEEDDADEQLKALLFILSYADGNHNLIDIKRLSGISLDNLCKYCNLLLKHNLLKF